MHGTLLKRSEWLLQWNCRTVILVPASNGLAAQLQWAGGSHPGLVSLDERSSASVVDGVLTLLRNGEKRAILFRSTPGEPTVEQWLQAINAARDVGVNGQSSVTQQSVAVSEQAAEAALRLKAQRKLVTTGATRAIEWRKEQIQKLCGAVMQASERISEAQAADGVVPSHFAGSAGMLMGAMHYYLAMVGSWAAPKVLSDTLPVERRGGVECDWVRVMEPKGAVLNIAPWNAPVLLSILPCLGALAAGNACVIKPPEATPATSALLAEIVAASVAPEAVTVIQGGPDMSESLIDLGFDHIMFTGGTSIGKLVMARAARTLTPVTLELGGKNPTVIDEMDDGFLAAAVKEIVGTKAYFSGEFCQCHDYCLVLDSMWDRFVDALRAAIEALGEKRIVRLIHRRHYERLKAMLTTHHGTSLPALPTPDDAGLRLAVTAVLEPAPSDTVMLEECFGPALPVLRVASIDEAIARANASPTGKPLVSYYCAVADLDPATPGSSVCLVLALVASTRANPDVAGSIPSSADGQDASHADAWLAGTSSGALAINAGPMRMQSNFNAAIHGVGNSGLGGASIWGEHVFTTFSHAKHVVRPRGGAFAGSIWGAGPYQPTPTP